MENIYLSEKCALDLITRERTCPPYGALMAGGPAVEAHLSDCQYCRDLAETDDGRFETLKSFFSGTALPVESVECGEVHSVLASAVPDTHNEHGWHNPPDVLVVEDEEAVGIKGVVRVVQLCRGLVLSGPNDVPLKSWDCSTFAEPWNSWPIPVSSLGRNLGRVSEEELAEVCENMAKPIPWLPEDSLIYAFRRLELNIGGFYGRHGAAQALALLEKSRKNAGWESRPSSSGSAKKHFFPTMSSSELRELFKSSKADICKVSFPARSFDYAAAADSAPMGLSEEDRFRLDRSFGPSSAGIVNVFDLASHESKGIDAEFRIRNGQLHILFELPGQPIDAVVLFGSEEEELWCQPKHRAERQFTMKLPSGEGRDFELKSLKVLVFVFGE